MKECKALSDAAASIKFRRDEFVPEYFLEDIESFTLEPLSFYFQKGKDEAHLKLILIGENTETEQAPVSTWEIDLSKIPGKIEVYVPSVGRYYFDKFDQLEGLVKHHFKISLKHENAIPSRNKEKAAAINNLVIKFSSRSMTMQEYTDALELCRLMEIKDAGPFQQIVRDDSGLHLYTTTIRNGKVTEAVEKLTPKYNPFENSAVMSMNNGDECKGIFNTTFKDFIQGKKKDFDARIEKSLQDLRTATDSDTQASSDVSSYTSKLNKNVYAEVIKPIGSLPDKFYSFHISKKPWDVLIAKFWGDDTPNVTVTEWNQQKGMFESKTLPITCTKPGHFTLDGRNFDSIEDLKRHCKSNYGVPENEFKPTAKTVLKYIDILRADTARGTRQKPDIKQSLQQLSLVPEDFKKKSWVLYTPPRGTPYLYTYEDGTEKAEKIVCTKGGYNIGGKTYATLQNMIDDLNKTHGHCLKALEKLNDEIKGYTKEIESAHVPHLRGGERSTSYRLFDPKFNPDNRWELDILRNLTTEDHAVQIIAKKAPKNSSGGLPEYVLTQSLLKNDKIHQDFYLIRVLVDPSTLRASLEIEDRQRNKTEKTQNIQSWMDEHSQELMKDNMARSYQEAKAEQISNKEPDNGYQERQLRGRRPFTKKKYSIDLKSVKDAGTDIQIKNDIKKSEYLDMCLDALEQTIQDYDTRNESKSMLHFWPVETDLEPVLNKLLDEAEKLGFVSVDFDKERIQERVKPIFERIRGLSEWAEENNHSKAAELLCRLAYECSLPDGLFSKGFVEKFKWLYGQYI